MGGMGVPGLHSRDHVPEIKKLLKNNSSDNTIILTMNKNFKPEIKLTIKINQIFYYFKLDLE